MAILRLGNCYRVDSFYSAKSHCHSFFSSLFKSITNTLMLSTLLLSALILSACQTIPSSSKPVGTQVPTTSKVSTPITKASNKADDVDNDIDSAMSSGASYSIDNDDYPIEPYISPQIPDNSYSIPSIDSDSVTVTDYDRNDSSVTSALPEVIDEPIYNPPIIPSRHNTSQAPEMPLHDELLQRARQNSQQQSRQSTSSNDDLPAFRNLMQVGTNQLQAGDLTAAENSFTRAQRLAPRSSAVYFYLSQVALKKNQPRKAEAMARRGLSVSEDASRRQALWQLILKSGQIQNNTRVIREAQQALR